MRNLLQTAIIMLVTNESVLLHLLFNLSQQFRENQSHPCAHPIYMIAEDLQNIKKSNSQNEKCTATLAYFSNYKLGSVMKPKLSFLTMTQVKNASHIHTNKSYLHYCDWICWNYELCSYIMSCNFPPNKTDLITIFLLRKLISYLCHFRLFKF